MISIFMGIVSMVIGLIFKTIIFTGLWTFFVMAFGIDFLVNYLLPESMNATNYPAFYPIYEKGLLIVASLPAVYITIQNILRLVFGDPDFSLFGAIFRRTSREEKKKTQPSADKEIISSEPKGVIFGKQSGKFIIKPEDKDGHILVIGGAGSGKSSCLAIPSLLSWEERVFAIDIKGELSAKTHKKRPNTKIFNPSKPTETFGYDPFYVLKGTENKVQDVREIALAIIPLSEKVADPFWIKSAQNMLTGALLYFYDLGLSFPDTITAIQGTPPQALIQGIAESDNENARLFCNQFIGLKDEVLSGIFTEMSNNILVFATDPCLKKALNNKKIITPVDLENGFDIYLSIEESKLEQWKSLLTLMVNQFLKHFERREEEHATPILFLLDEFARLGKIETVINGLATLRSKKITIAILTQSLAQLDSIYGKEQRQVIADNCQFKAILNATDADTQEYFSKLVGTYDKLKVSQNANFEQYTGLGKGTGKSRTTEEKRIIKPEEFGTLKDIILLTPYGFYRANKAPYYQEKIFIDMVS